MAKEKICGIYCVENLVNGKKYIGQSINVYQRWCAHKSKLNKNQHPNEKLQNTWNKHGAENFNFYVIVECDVDSLDEFEIYYINLYQSYKFGYNKDLGGNKNKIISDEIRQKMRDTRQNISEQTRENMRNAQETKPIYQIDFSGNIVNKWSGAREASKKLNMNQADIWRCLHHKRLTLHGFIWIFIDEYDAFDLSKYLNQSTQSRTIVQKMKNGDIIKIWESANSAKKFGFDPSSIIKCCKGKRSHYKGFLWDYYND